MSPLKFFCALLLMVPACALAAPPDYTGYAEVLSAYVSDEGRVDYKELQKNRAGLDAFVESLGAVSAADYTSWEDPDKIALWVNAYNAVTLKVIIDHYPIKPHWKTRLLYPHNSIRQIPGAWKKIKTKIVGRAITLYDMENEVLRKDFKEPGIHMGLVCASISCPRLRNEPYTGAKLQDQFADQATGFFSNPGTFKLDRKSGVVALSPIFKWFPDDFLAHAKASPAGFSKSINAALNYAAGFVSEADASWIAAGGYRVDFLDYDWSLNEK